MVPRIVIKMERKNQLIILLKVLKKFGGYVMRVMKHKLKSMVGQMDVVVTYVLTVLMMKII